MENKRQGFYTVKGTTGQRCSQLEYMHACTHARTHTHTHTHTLPRWNNGKESTCVQARTHAINPPASSGDAGLIPGSGRSPGEGNGNPLQYSCLENAMERGAWWATVHGVTKSQTRLTN